MKRFWLVLLSLGLVMAFSASAFAVDVKFSGSYYAAGVYVDRASLSGTTVADPTATSFYFQKLQLKTEFIVSPGLTLTTRANIMERVWGGARSVASTTGDVGSAASTAENQNIGFDHAYLTYASPIGRIQAGYMHDGIFGTVFGDNSAANPRITYLATVADKLSLFFVVAKVAENSHTSVTPGSASQNNDSDKYAFAFWWTEKNWDAGLMAVYYQYNSGNAATTGNGPYTSKYYTLQPYGRANIGPLKIQAELNWFVGSAAKYEWIGNTDVDYNSLAYWIDATATFGPVYVGGTFAYAQGQGTDASKNNTKATGGRDWSPTLILWNENLAYWNGLPTSGVATYPADSGTSYVGMTNAYLYQLRVGVKPTAKADICVSGTFAQADTLNSQVGYVSKDYGYEIDATGTYQITNNLSYMLGFGYFITGDYFKGTSSSNVIKNDYLVINKLTLTF